MNAEKLEKLKSQVRIGGKGTPRRKKKIVSKASGTDDKKLQQTLKRLGASNIPGVEEVNMIRDDGKVIHFDKPKVQAHVRANTFSISGKGETKEMTELLPGILNQLGRENLTHLKQVAEAMEATSNTTGETSEIANPEAGDDDDDDVPDLVDNFDQTAQ